MPGDRAVVTRINGAGVTVRQRLLEMGLVKGAFVELIRFAPMGDPLEIRVGRYRLSLRRVEAATVIVCKEAR
ncbi:MAG: ferrous iron transport protein A [Ignavibacteriae bacterium]|nr:ferrous iron transport protein A [Ignavibacteriota bacterium]